ncbi:MAG: hypothetical protein E7012_01660 [Alphaproteobacteria bacterium]|nr:hypothetical protein [Alphaproteobacteria bacterium]
MRYLLVTTTIIAGLAYTSSALAQTCTAAPSCEEMGYTKSETDCTGKISLRCPFDLTKVSCEKESSDNSSDSIKTISDLRWSEYIDFESPFTLPANGCLFFTPGVVTNYSNANYYDIYIDGKLSREFNNIFGSELAVVCLKKNQVLEATTHSSNTAMQGKFVPLNKIEINCKIGDIYYSDDTCLSTYTSTKTPLGIVIDDVNKIVLALSERTSSAAWNGPSSVDETFLNNITSPESDISGFTNTAKLILNNSKNYYTIFNVCLSSTIGGKTWYAPAAGELSKVIANIDIIQNRLNYLNELGVRDGSPSSYITTPLFDVDSSSLRDAQITRYITSSEYDAKYFWTLGTSGFQKTSKTIKNGSYDTAISALRCVFTYENDDISSCSGYDRAQEKNGCTYSSCSYDGVTLYKVISCCDDYDYTDEDEAYTEAEILNEKGYDCWVDECIADGYYGYYYKVICD